MKRLVRFTSSLRRKPVQAFALVLSVCAIGFVIVFVGQRLEAWRRYRAAESALGDADRGDLEQLLPLALDHLNSYLDLRPGSPEARLLTARTARRLSQFDRAQAELQLARTVGAPTEAIALENDLIRAQQGDLASIEMRLKYFVDNEHPDSAAILEAMVPGYLRTFQLPRAMACLDLWLELQPGNLQALLGRGQTNRLLDRFDEALADFRRAVAIDPTHRVARQALAEILIYGNKADEAAGHFEELLAGRPNDAALALGLARCRIQMGATTEARQLLDDILQRAPENGQALALRGKLALEANDTLEAERYLRKAVGVAPYEREFLHPLYLSLERLKKTDEARQYLARFHSVEADMNRMKDLTREIMVRPHEAELRTEAGLILLRNGQDRGGVSWLRSALIENPNHLPARRALVRFYESIGETKAAAVHRQYLRSPATP